MKTLKIILASTLMSSVVAFANTAKVQEPTKKVYEVLEGNSKASEKKFGLAVDLTYKSQHVDVGEVSDVTINITTGLTEGTLKIKMNALDDALNGLDEELKEFKLSETNNRFTIDLKLSSAVDGRHYLNLLLNVEGKGSRVFVVPVNVGTLSSKVSNKAVEKTDKGIAISVSAAQEEIK